jgi:MoaA/NifB/PqqE/SkfB family radical SAM enzyme
MPTEKRLFCSKPFRWFEVTELRSVKGEVVLCCPGWLDTSVGNLQHQSIEEIWNGEKAQNIRRSILNGSFEYCNRSVCPFLQTKSGPVQIVEDVEDPYLKESIEKNLTVLPYGPKEINCCYDKSCNLSCPSCRTGLIMETGKKDQIEKIQRKIQEKGLKDAVFLSITGSGDPFGSPFFRKWLQTMKREEMPNLERIHLHTNGLLWTPITWRKIPEEVRQLVKTTEISIDAASPETYAVNRRGGDFEKLLENLEFIGELRKYGFLTNVTISMVVQENNFTEMHEFVRLGLRFGFDTVYFSQLVNWGTYSDKDFCKKAVHHKGHPRYLEFVDILNNEICRHPIVYAGNLTMFIDQ